MANCRSRKGRPLGGEQLEDRKLMAVNVLGLAAAADTQCLMHDDGMGPPWLRPDNGMWFTVSNSEASDDLHTLTVLWSTPGSDTDPSIAKWTGFQKQMSASDVDAFFTGGDNGVGDLAEPGAGGPCHGVGELLRYLDGVR